MSTKWSTKYQNHNNLLLSILPPPFLDRTIDTNDDHGAARATVQNIGIGNSPFRSIIVIIIIIIIIIIVLVVLPVSLNSRLY